MKWLAAFALASGIVMLIRLFCIESYRISTDSMEEALKDATILYGPFTPVAGMDVAFIEEEGVPIELDYFY